MNWRTILHVDLDAFFCSVEELLDPSLRGKAFVVGGSPEGRGVVTSASYPARKFGIRSAMPASQAIRLCPDLIMVRSRHRKYGEYSRKVMELLREAAPIVQQISIDEAFLDVSDDPLSGEQVAAALQEEIRSRLGLPTSWGVASNKLVAKIASEVGKPNGLVVVPQGEEAAFLAPLPVQMLWGVGPKSRDRFREVGIRTIGDLAALSEDRLAAILGERGMELAARARGIDARPVAEGHEAKSMSTERTFREDVASWPELRRTLLKMSETLGRRLRRQGFVGSTVRIKLRWPDFTTLTRQARLDQPTDQDGEIFSAALELTRKAWKRGRAIRLMGVGVADLGPPLRQLNLFDASWLKDERLLQALDDIRNRYGPRAIRRAGTMREDSPENGE